MRLPTTEATVRSEQEAVCEGPRDMNPIMTCRAVRTEREGLINATTEGFAGLSPREMILVPIRLKGGGGE